MNYKFYIPASTRYVEFENVHDITVWNVHEGDGKVISIMYQNGETDLEVHELISIGQITEVFRQVKKGTREYDPYAIFSPTLKRAALQKANSKWAK